MVSNAIKLPREARAYLRTHDGKWSKRLLRFFHRWMNDNNLIYSALTPAHLNSFWEHLQQKYYSKSTMYGHRCQLNKYMYWLHNRGCLRFAVDPPLLRHLRAPLPEFAAKYVKTCCKSRQHRIEVQKFHSWLNCKSITLAELTPLHIATYLRRPIRNRIGEETSKVMYFLLEPYLCWLYEHGHLKSNITGQYRKPLPLPQCAIEFMDTRRPVRKKSTCDHYANTLRQFHIWLNAQNLSLKEIGRSSMERWLKSLYDQRLSQSTRCASINHMQLYFRWLWERGDIEVDPDELLRVTDRPKIPSFLPRPFPPAADREMQKRLVDMDSVDSQALLLMRRTGVRIGELVRLEWACVDTDYLGYAFLRVPLGKLDNERLVPLDDRTRILIEKLQQQSARCGEYLLLNDQCRDAVKQQLNDTLRQVASGLEIPGSICSHRLRHTFATEMLNAGMSIGALMKILGHRTLRMTMRYAAIHQETVVREYHAAMAKIEAQYYPPGQAGITAEPDPDRMLTDTISWLRKHFGDNPLQKNHAELIIKRIYRIRDDLKAFASQNHPT
jgi:site-specific recombinase XerD